MPEGLFPKDWRRTPPAESTRRGGGRGGESVGRLDYARGVFHRQAFSQDQAFFRYYAHKLARLIVPKSVADFVDMRYADRFGISVAPLHEFSHEFKSKVRQGGPLAFLDPHPREAQVAKWRSTHDRTLRALGFVVDTDPWNVDFGPDGRAFCLEVLNLHPGRIRQALVRLPARQRDKGLSWLVRLEHRLPVRVEPQTGYYQNWTLHQSSRNTVVTPERTVTPAETLRVREFAGRLARLNAAWLRRPPDEREQLAEEASDRFADDGP